MHRRTFLKLPLLCLVKSFPALAEGRQALEFMVHRDYGDGQEIARRNNQYLIDNLNGIEDIEKAAKVYMASGHNKSVSRSQCRMQADYASYGWGHTFVSGNRAPGNLSIRQRLRAYVLIKSLKDSVFRRTVMDEIEKDLDDPQTKEGYFAAEYGGLCKLERNLLRLHPVPSIDALAKPISYDSSGNSWAIERKGTNGRYMMPEQVPLIEPYVFKYHMHAVHEDSSAFCGPSIGIDENGFKVGDIGVLIGEVKKEGEAHELVFTKLPGMRFNVVYYTAESLTGKVKSGDAFPIIILNIGDWAL